MIVAKNTLAVLLSSALSNEQKTLPITDAWLIKRLLGQCTEVGFTNFLYGIFTVVAIVNPPDGKLVKFKFSKKATKLSIITSNQVGDYFKFLWPFQNVRTLYVVK